MPTGVFGGFPFDPEVYMSYVYQEPVFTDSIIASGVTAADQTMANVLNDGGTVGTARFYNPIDPETDAPLVRDGTNDNTPVTTDGGKQSFIRIDRMKAWKALQLTREITGADPMQALAHYTGLYWRAYNQSLLTKIAGTVLQVSGLTGHVYTAANGVDAAMVIDGQQAALGEFARNFGLYVMHSKVFAAYQKLGLVDYNKYTITNVLQREVELPTINGLIVVVNDRGTSHTSGESTVYDCFLFGQGAFLTASPKVITPDYTDYDPALGGGTDILYNNRSLILHPNGVSFVADNIAGETPTDTELTTVANWALKFQHQNVRIGKIEVPADKL